MAEWHKVAADRLREAALDAMRVDALSERKKPTICEGGLFFHYSHDDVVMKLFEEAADLDARDATEAALSGDPRFEAGDKVVNEDGQRATIAGVEFMRPEATELTYTVIWEESGTPDYNIKESALRPHQDRGRREEG